MKRIFAISPDYMSALVEESKEYTFGIQCYSTVDLAIENLITINLSEVYGFVFLSNAILEEDVEPFSDLFDKLKRIINSRDEFIFVFVVNSTDYLYEIVDRGKEILGNNFKFYGQTDFNLVTDRVVKDAFGAIIKFNEEKEKVILNIKDINKVKKPYTVQSDKIVSNLVTSITDDVHVMNSLEDTVNNDITLSEFRKIENLLPVYGLVRRFYIECEYARVRKIAKMNDYEYKEFCDNRLNSKILEKELNMLEHTDEESYIHLVAIIKYVESSINNIEDEVDTDEKFYI